MNGGAIRERLVVRWAVVCLQKTHNPTAKVVEGVWQILRTVLFAHFQHEVVQPVLEVGGDYIA